MGLVYLPAWMVDFFVINVGKYIIHGCYGNKGLPLIKGKISSPLAEDLI